ncbi:hypothetical protein GCM10020367_14380 [Streptomyces sannanensis]|uniref:Uncharacterized protein n=1 Tax=Streptomyces sannanensis TaxID=285536 RepID=A0ABP6S783_9ACTN
MGVVETLVHTHEMAEGLGLDWNPPADLCGRVLHRLFPDAPTDTDRRPTLLWVTGRAELPGREGLTKWCWYGAPHVGSWSRAHFNSWNATGRRARARMSSKEQDVGYRILGGTGGIGPRTMGQLRSLAVKWQRAAAGDWCAYAAGISRRTRSS